MVRRTRVVARLVLVVLLLSTVFAAIAAKKHEKAAKPGEHGPTYTKQFFPTACRFSSDGSNSFFRLDPGYQLVYEGKEDDASVRLVISVLSETLTVNGVETRIVEEREWTGGELAEVSRNYFALCGQTSDLYYFGEDVDNYRGGKIVNHEGSWRAGVAGARQGVLLPGSPLLGSHFYQEIAPGVAMDRARVSQLVERMKVKAGAFEKVLELHESSDLEPGKSIKFFAPGVGMIKDDELELVEYGMFDRRSDVAGEPKH